MKKVALIGYSGHALVVADILYGLEIEIIGYFEKKAIINNPFRLDYLGYEQDVDFTDKAKKFLFFISIGDNVIRRRVMDFLLERKIQVATVISHKANVSISAKVDIGTLICNGVCINPFAKIGKGVIINTSAIIEHECIVGNYSHIASGAVLSGNVHIGENCLVGANSSLKQGVIIGNNVIVGAGSVVLKDIPDGEVWVGNPARKLK